MSNYMYRLEVPAGKMRFSVAEALEATTSAIYPASAAQQPVMVVSLGKEPYPRDGKFGGIEAKSELWAAAGFKDTLLRWKLKPEVGYGNETAIQPGV